MIEDDLFRIFKDKYSGKSERKSSKELLLVNYMPVTRIVNNVIMYAFLNCTSDGINVCYKKSPNAFNPLSPVESKSASNLAYENFNDFVTDNTYSLLRRFFNEHDVEVSVSANTSIDNSIKSYHIIEELDAVLLITNEFSALEELCKGDNFNSTSEIDISGFLLPSVVKSSLMSVEQTSINWLRICYYNYLVKANLELGEYYHNFVGYSMGCQRKLFVLLQEFVPFMYKFQGIPNVLSDSEIWDRIPEKYPVFSSWEISDFYGSVCRRRITDRVSERDRFVCYMSRSFYLKIIGANPKITNTTDTFSYKRYNAPIYDTILRGLGYNIFWNMTSPGYVWYTPQDSGTLSILRYDSRPAPSVYQSFQVNGLSMLVIEYYLKLVGHITLTDLAAIVNSVHLVNGSSLSDIQEV
jgi:hypothetical protein